MEYTTLTMSAKLWSITQTCALTTLHLCFSKSLASFRAIQAQGCLLDMLYSFHAIRAACKPFSQLPNRSAWFLNGTTSLCIIERRPARSKTGWPVYKSVVYLQTGQICNLFTICIKSLSPKHIAQRWGNPKCNFYSLRPICKNYFLEHFAPWYWSCTTHHSDRN